MWLKPQGFAEVITPIDDVLSLDHIRKEAITSGQHRMDTCTCAHCNSVFHISARMRPEDIGGMCPSCWQPICPKCLDGPCIPWEVQMERLENAIQKRRAIDGYF